MPTNIPQTQPLTKLPSPSGSAVSRQADKESNYTGDREKELIEVIPLCDCVAELCKQIELPPDITAAAIEAGTRLAAAGYAQDCESPSWARACIAHASNGVIELESFKGYGRRKGMLEVVDEVVKGELQILEDSLREATPDMFRLYTPLPSWTPAEHCAVYCSYLRLQPRTTNIAIDLVTKITTNDWDKSHSKPAMAAACNFAASHLMNEVESAQKLADAAGVTEMKGFWSAYQRVWEKRHELVTGEIKCHGADVERLPEPGMEEVFSDGAVG